ncbi:mucoidy inhibitor MuiA family protein [Bacteroidales bacterium OttesenSCG-928-C19]|nr:mucoidy inhibitor MuiA family protein [Bacteroidales bacterium OttesenSCG-928-C19]
MKKLTSLAIGLAFCSISFAQKTADYTISKADVYLSGAKLYTQSKIQLEQGSHTIYIRNITNSLVEGSLQAKVSNGASLVSVNSGKNYIESGEVSKREKELLDSQKKLNQQIRLLRIDNETLNEEMNLVKELIRGKNEKTQSYTVTQLQELSKFYASKISELKKSVYSTEQQIAKTQEELNKVNAQLNEERSAKYKNSQQVELIVNVTTPGMKTIDLDYFVYNCGWNPEYDIKAEGKDKPIDIIYKASVWQSTGIDWTGTEITLMSNQPSQDQNRPVLNPLYVDIYNPQPTVRKSTKSEEVMEDEVMYSNMLEVSRVPSADAAGYGTTITVTDININYAIPGKQTIAGNGKPKLLTMDSKKVESRFVYHAVPKLNEQVYLLGYIPNWSRLNLMNGTANIYLKDAFIGHINIDERFTGEEYPLSFGVDNRISIKRTKKQDFSSEAKIGSDKRENISYDITIRNNLTTGIDVEVLDQVPVSKNKNIKVSLNEKGTAEYTENIGLLKWTVPVGAGASNTIKFSYEVKYPKDNQVNYMNY